MHRVVLSAMVLLCPAVLFAAAPRVAVVVGKDAPALDRLAADEVAEHLQRLFAAQVDSVVTIPDDAANLILIGNPETNPAVKAAGDVWPKLTAQGHALKSVRVAGKPALVVGGGSPIATFWAASELGHRWGVRTLLFDNLLPADVPPFSLDGFDVVMEPTFERRSWARWDGAAGLVEQKRLLRQLARLKFNRIELPLAAWEPCVAWKFDGMETRSAEPYEVEAIRVDGDTAGRAAFKGAKRFENPDLAGKATWGDRTRAGAEFVNALIDEAHRLGMTVALGVAPFSFPEEFGGLLPRREDGSRRSADRRLDDLKIEASKGEPNVRGAAATRLRAVVHAFPAMDVLTLTMPSGQEELSNAAWGQLQDAGVVPRTLSLETITDAANARTEATNGKVAERWIRSEVAMMPAIRELIENRSIHRRRDGSALPIGLSGCDPALGWLMARIAPDGAQPFWVPETLTAPGQPPETASRLTDSEAEVAGLLRFGRLGLRDRSHGPFLLTGCVRSRVDARGVDPRSRRPCFRAGRGRFGLEGFFNRRGRHDCKRTHG